MPAYWHTKHTLTYSYPQHSFAWFAVFPEDIPVPFEVFTALTEIMTGAKGSKKVFIQIRTALTTLLNYNLIKGSVADSHGVFMASLIPTSLSPSPGHGRTHKFRPQSCRGQQP